MIAVAVAVAVCALTMAVVASLAIHYWDRAAAECGEWDDLPALDRHRRDVAALRRATRTETL